MQRLNPLLPLPLTQLPQLLARDPEKRRRRLNQPLRLYNRRAVHVLLTCQHQRVENHVFRRFAE